MHRSIKQFFLKDSVFIGSVVCASVLWIANGVLNVMSGSYRSLFNNILYLLCLLTMCGAEFNQQENVKQGMIGALMITFITGNANLLFPALGQLADSAVPSRASWQLAVSFVLALGLFLNHFMLTNSKYNNRKRIALNQIDLLLILILRCYQILINFSGGNFSMTMIKSTVGMLAIIPMMNAIICMECRGVYKNW